MTTRRLLGSLSAVLLLATIAFHAPAARAAITIDGSLADWTAADILYSDGEIANASPADAAYNTVYVTNDATYLYVAIVTDGGNGGSILNDWTHNLYLDTDANGATGFNAGWMTHGYDHLVQYGSGGTVYSAFSFAGVNQASWGWSFVNTFGYSFSGNVAEWAIPLAAIGNPTAIVMEFNTTGGSVTTEGWANAIESGAKTFTLVPEPATAALLGGALLLFVGRKRRAA